MYARHAFVALVKIIHLSAGFNLTQKFRGGNMGEVEVMAALAAQGGGCGNGICPLPRKTREAKASININVPIKAPK